MSETSNLAAFNARPRPDAEAELLRCCASRAFAAGVAALRPFAEVQGLLDTADRAVRRLGWGEVLEALGAHPRIGERAGGREGAWSRQEQSGVEDEVRAALAEGNRAYEERFGHVYLVCASGLSGTEMLAMLRGRLGNDEAAERNVVRGELSAITRLRLVKLMEEGR
ncbi:2-oxo-4-hydroxy-4-carboxy-5-ureidoimidazoline decarboxylase [Nonomuraea sp. NPDC046802]|uniref:2-oxo-4-hydroxy-4-carboxy-5-ureidoimidazoline decarboxylase n=1 Tax=Nonomuraea sp. NPDC046802 TaxID=3154919 RepID=UPI0033DF005C